MSLKCLYTFFLFGVFLAACSSKQASVDNNRFNQEQYAVTASVLQDHRWRLESASSDAGQRIDALFPTDNPFEFTFTESSIFVSGGCNGLRARYQINAQGELLLTTPMISTMMACELVFMEADETLHEVFKKPQQLSLVQGEQPVLTLSSKKNEVLVLIGQKTYEALYGPPTQVFLEVAAKSPACPHPSSSSQPCLQIREIHFDEQGLRVGIPGQWQTFNGVIEGYKHTPGTQSVLRVKRFQSSSVDSPDQTKTGEGSFPIFVLDLLVETGVPSLS